MGILWCWYIIFFILCLVDDKLVLGNLTRWQINRICVSKNSCVRLNDFKMYHNACGCASCRNLKLLSVSVCNNYYRAILISSVHASLNTYIFTPACNVSGLDYKFTRLPIVVLFGGPTIGFLANCVNALSPLYCGIKGFATIEQRAAGGEGATIIMYQPRSKSNIEIPELLLCICTVSAGTHRIVKSNILAFNLAVCDLRSLRV